MVPSRQTRTLHSAYGGGEAWRLAVSDMTDPDMVLVVIPVAHHSQDGKARGFGSLIRMPDALVEPFRYKSEPQAEKATGGDA